MTRHLHIEPVGGLAGDMFLGACIDLGVSLDDLTAALSPLELACELTADRAERHSIGCVDFRVRAQVAGNQEQGTGHSHSHPTSDISHPTSHHHHHTHYSDIMAMIDKLALTDRAADRAGKIVTVLAEAEAAVHNTTIEKVHFHEVGAIDSIVDMLGAAIALELLEVDTISCASLPLGHGQIKCAHGIVPLPAPATVNILRGKPTHGVDRRCETLTPTGAAIAAACCESFGPQPSMTVDKIGYGCGDRDDPDVANVVRLLME